MFKQMVGSLRYLCNSRLDICYAVGVISRFMNTPRRSHLIAAKRVLRYVKGTINYGLLFPKCKAEVQMELIAVCWSSKKQPVTTLSSCEAEYIASTYAACQLVWLEALMQELKCNVKKPLQLLIDN
ncbi:copia protein, partial [Trifolium medium]|nr:copia protein [Trifolium medium]